RPLPRVAARRSRPATALSDRRFGGRDRARRDALRAHSMMLNLGVMDVPGLSAYSPGAMFYTYVHRQKNDPLTIAGVFYVGKGKARRAWQSQRRGARWNVRATQGGGFIAEILEHWPTEHEAYDHERKLIADFKAQGARLVNLTE